MNGKQKTTESPSMGKTVPEGEKEMSKGNS